MRRISLSDGLRVSALLTVCGSIGCSGEEDAAATGALEDDTSLPTPYDYAPLFEPPLSTGSGSFEAIGTLKQALVDPVYGTVTYVGDIPSNKDTDWFDHAQGVALAPLNGVINMFYSVNTRIRGREAQSSSQFGVSQSFPGGNWDINSFPPGLPSSYNHFGDLDYVENGAGTSDLLYVPIEGNQAVDHPVLAVYSVSPPNSWTLQSTAVLAQNPSNQAPWISAWTPNPRYLVSSAFTASSVQMYFDASLGAAVSFTAPAQTVQLRNASLNSITLSRIQGGEFNKAGKLFLLAEIGPDTSVHPSGSGVYGFDFVTLTSGELVLKMTDYYFAAISTDDHKNEEFEGITCGTINPPGANDDSQVHAILNQDGSIFFKHWRMSQGLSGFAP